VCVVAVAGLYIIIRAGEKARVSLATAAADADAESLPVVWVLRRNEIERIPATGRHATAVARPSGWSHPERRGQLPVSAHAARARTLAHTDANTPARTHVYARTHALAHSITR